MACTKQEDEFIELNPNNGKLMFTSDINTKASIITNDSFDNFGVFVFNSGIDNWDSTINTPNYLYNKEVNRHKVNNIWSDWYYTPTMYWPQKGNKLSFYAYSPYATLDNNIQISDKTQLGIPTLTYKVPVSINEQQDILYADPIFNLERNNHPVK